FPGEEDFGIAPLEANASGRPVIAYAGGGALDTVVDGRTGVLFQHQNVDSLIGAIHRAEATAWDSDELRRHARRFDRQVFREQLLRFVGEAVAAPAAGARFARRCHLSLWEWTEARRSRGWGPPRRPKGHGRPIRLPEAAGIRGRGDGDCGPDRRLANPLHDPDPLRLRLSELRPRHPRLLQRRLP